MADLALAFAAGGIAALTVYSLGCSLISAAFYFRRTLRELGELDSTQDGQP